MTTIDGIWPDNNLVGGQRTLRATTRTLGLEALAHGLHLLRSARCVVLASFRRAPTAIRTILARVVRRFADFAQIPYQDALIRRELSGFLDEFEAECRTNRLDQRGLCDAQFLSMHITQEFWRSALCTALLP